MNEELTVGVFCEFLFKCTGCANKKNNPSEKMLQFTYGSTHLSQTFSLCTGVFSQHML